MLAAGEGTRLRPLTQLRPKPLCPVGDETMLDRALRHVRAATSSTAVNAHHLAGQVARHIEARWPETHLSVEQPEALGTAGAIGQLRPWIDGAPALIANGDAWHDRDPVPELLKGWDGERPRLLVIEDPSRPDFGKQRFAGLSLLPWRHAVELEPVPAGLYEATWRALLQDGEIELVGFSGLFIDCGTPDDYRRANLAASGGESVVGADAVVEGEVVRSVVWPGARVEAGERLIDAIRADAGVTVQVGGQP